MSQSTILKQMIDSNYNEYMNPYAQRIHASPSTVYLGDLPKDLTQLELYKFLKENYGECELILKK